MLKPLYIALVLCIGAFNFAFARTNAGVALENAVNAFTTNTIKSMVRASDGLSVLISENIPSSFPNWTGNIAVTGVIGQSITWMKNQTTGFPSISAWRDFNDTRSYDPQIPWQPGSNFNWLSYTTCTRVTDGTTVKWWIRQDGTSQNGFTSNYYGAYTFSHQADLTGTIAAPGGQTFLDNDGTPDYTTNSLTVRMTQNCAQPVTYSQWMDGTYSGGSAHTEVVSEVRTAIKRWIAGQWDTLSTWSDPSGVAFAPTYQLVDASDCTGDCETAGDGSDPGGGDTGGGDGTSPPAGEGSESGACEQIAGNWFVHFWENIENTVLCLVVPTVSIQEKNEELRVSMSEKMPLGFLFFIDDVKLSIESAGLHEDGTASNQSNTGLPQHCADNYWNLQIIQTEQWNESININPCNTTSFTWWHENIRPMLAWAIPVVFLFLIVQVWRS